MEKLLANPISFMFTYSLTEIAMSIEDKIAVKLNHHFAPKKAERLGNKCIHGKRHLYRRNLQL